LKRKNAEILANKTIKILTPYKAILHTITSDNGKEFAAHQKIAEALDCDFYFAKPYHSWQSREQ
jgi:IS30 family transposase